jgi:multiple sugar transport system substrate-binding protein
MRDAKLTRRGFLGGVAASAAAAILAACGGSNATDTPKPAAPTTAPTSGAAVTAAPTSAAGSAAAATRPAGSATTGAAATTAPAAGTTAAGTTTSGTGTTGTTTASNVAVGTVPIPPPDKYKGQKLAMISRQEYFKGTQDVIDQELQTFAKQIGVEITNDHLNVDAGDTVSRQDAAVKSGNVQDMMYGAGYAPQWHQLDDIIDVSDVVEELQKVYGPVEDGAKIDAFFDGKWYGIPYQSNAGGYFVRKDWLDEKGIKVDSIKTWENARDVALEISDPSKNRFGWGNTWNRSGDGNSNILGPLYSYGGAYTNNEGTKVVFNSPETVAAITFLADIFTNAKYKNMLPPGINSWTDPSNNEAWLAGTVGLTQNAYTLYAKSYADKNPVYDKTAIVAGFIGPGTDQIINEPGSQYFVIFKGAKNVPLAKETAKHMVGGSPLLNVAKVSLGLVMPVYKGIWGTDPFYTNGDPSFPALRKLIEAPLPIKSKTGYTFPQTPSPGQNAVQSQYILPDMMGEIILKGVKVQDAVKAAHDRMVQVFEQLGLKQ